MRQRKHPHSASAGTPTPSPSPQGGGGLAVAPNLSGSWAGTVAGIFPSPLRGGARGGGIGKERPVAIRAPLLSPVERGRGAERGEAEWGSTCLAPSEATQ